MSHYEIMLTKPQTDRILRALRELDKIDPVNIDHESDGYDPDLDYLTQCFATLPDPDSPDNYANGKNMLYGFCL